MNESPVVIEAENLAYRYPFCREPALSDVSFRLRRGEAMLVTGASGCGKSTLLRLLNGLIPNHFKGTPEGRLTVCGIDCPAPLERLSRRIGTVLQDPDEQFMATTVEEEVALTLEWQCRPRGEILERVGEALRVLDLTDLAARSVFGLSSGEKQKAVLASVIAARADLVVMDEPTANLSPEATEELAALCLRLKSLGVTLVIVDHRLYWLRGVLDRLLVLAHGRPVLSAERTPGGKDLLDSLAAHPGVARWGLRSTDVGRPELPEAAGFGLPAVEVRGLSFRYGRRHRWIFRDFSASLPRGAVTAVVGANGAGKTTLARLLCGLSRPAEGELLYGGLRLSRRLIREQAAFVMQQMDIQLYMRTVRDELLYSAPRGVPREERGAQADRLLATFGLTHLADRHPHSLSGGEKQRLVVACALMKRPTLLILDEPTSGLDGRNMRIIADELAAFARGGGTVLLITHDLELLARVAQCRLTVAAPLSTLTFTPNKETA